MRELRKWCAKQRWVLFWASTPPGAPLGHHPPERVAGGEGERLARREVFGNLEREPLLAVELFNQEGPCDAELELPLPHNASQEGGAVLRAAHLEQVSAPDREALPAAMQQLHLEPFATAVEHSCGLKVVLPRELQPDDDDEIVLRQGQRVEAR